MARKPNYHCSVCEKHIYKRPSDINRGRTFCSLVCANSIKKLEPVSCESCNIIFTPTIKKVRFCSHACSNTFRKGSKFKKENVRYSNSTTLRFHYLKEAFNFNSCMIEGCTYNKTYDLHRLIEGKDGGQYVIGNMFAICPNHHAEIHRNVIEVEKVNDYTLRII